LEDILIKTLVPKFSDPNNVVTEKEDTMCLTFKVVISHNFNSMLDALYQKSLLCAKEMIKDRTKSSSKYYPIIPSAVSKSLISKYQKNKKLKEIKNLVIPICGDKGRQVKTVEGGIRIPALFKKEIIPVTFPKPILGTIRQVEFFKRNKKWYMSYSYNTPCLKTETTFGFIGVDRNSVDNVVTIADASTGKFRKIGPCIASITKNFRNRRKNLQIKGAKNALVKIKGKQSRRIKEINHKVSRTIVDYAKEHRSVLVLEDLGQISKKGKSKKYVQKSQWSFYQLETFIKYKAALLGVPILYVNPAYTSQICSKCGSLNKSNGKHYKCSKCGYFCHRDVNAAFNISKLGDKTVGEKVPIVGLIDDPPNQRAQKGTYLESSGGAR
jgi:putative transposase